MKRLWLNDTDGAAKPSLMDFNERLKEEAERQRRAAKLARRAERHERKEAEAERARRVRAAMARQRELDKIRAEEAADEAQRYRPAVVSYRLPEVGELRVTRGDRGVDGAVYLFRDPDVEAACVVVEYSQYSRLSYLGDPARWPVDLRDDLDWDHELEAKEKACEYDPAAMHDFSPGWCALAAGEELTQKQLKVLSWDGTTLLLGAEHELVEPEYESEYGVNQVRYTFMCFRFEPLAPPVLTAAGAQLRAYAALSKTMDVPRIQSDEVVQQDVYHVPGVGLLQVYAAGTLFRSFFLYLDAQPTRPLALVLLRIAEATPWREDDARWAKHLASGFVKYKDARLCESPLVRGLIETDALNRLRLVQWDPKFLRAHLDYAYDYARWSDPRYSEGHERLELTFLPVYRVKLAAADASDDEGFTFEPLAS